MLSKLKCRVLQTRTQKSLKSVFPKTWIVSLMNPENGEGLLDKEVTSHDNLFDAFRMSLLFWH
jgi:hypothetical protein